MTRHATSGVGALVSVVVPTYNHERYIGQCLSSVQEQTHERLELVIIDDCSSDGTFEFVKNVLATPFARRFENIVLHRKTECRGAYDSLNLGLREAKGEYIAVANSDDLLTPRRVERLVEAITGSGSELAFSLVEVNDDEIALDGLAEQATPQISIPPNLLLLELSQQAALARDASVGFAMLRSNVAVSSGNCVFSAGIAKKIGGFRALRRHYAWDFLLQSLAYAEPSVVKEPLYVYRLHRRNLFQENERLVATETEALFRRFFRSVATRRPANRLCPCPENWPGYFEAIVRTIGLWDYWAKEAGGQLPFWRTYDRAEWGATDPPGLITSTDEAVRYFQANERGELTRFSPANRRRSTLPP